MYNLFAWRKRTLFSHSPSNHIVSCLLRASRDASVFFPWLTSFIISLSSDCFISPLSAWIQDENICTFNSTQLSTKVRLLNRIRPPGIAFFTSLLNGWLDFTRAEKLFANALVCHEGAWQSYLLSLSLYLRCASAHAVLHLNRRQEHTGDLWSLSVSSRTHSQVCFR